MDEMNYPQFRFNPQAEDFVPAAPSTSTVTSTTSSASNADSPALLVPNKIDMRNTLRDRFRYELEMIQRDPEEVQTVALSIRKEYEESQTFRNEVIHILLDEIMALVLSKDSFAYSGARLCSFFSEFKELLGNRTLEADKAFFHFDDLLMDRLYDEFTYAKEATTTGNCQQRIHNFLVFFCSLITQKQMPLVIQRELLVFLRDLLSNQNYFKTIATVLKIGGAFFDSCESRWALDTVMRRLLKVARNLPKDSLPYRQLYGLIELRAVGWDWDDPVELSTLNINKSEAATVPTTGYEQIAPYNTFSFGFQPSEMEEFVLEDEIDEEASEAYEQFLLQTGQLVNNVP